MRPTGTEAGSLPGSINLRCSLAGKSELLRGCSASSLQKGEPGGRVWRQIFSPFRGNWFPSTLSLGLLVPHSTDEKVITKAKHRKLNEEDLG